MSLSASVCYVSSAPGDRSDLSAGIVFIQFTNGSCGEISDTLILILESLPAASLVVGVPYAYFELTELQLDQQGKKLKIFPNDLPLPATV